jgi:hypothetical protein
MKIRAGENLSQWRSRILAEKCDLTIDQIKALKAGEEIDIGMIDVTDLVSMKVVFVTEENVETPTGGESDGDQ